MVMMGLSWSRCARLALGCPSRAGEAGLEGEVLEDMASLCQRRCRSKRDDDILRGMSHRDVPGGLVESDEAKGGFSTVVSLNVADQSRCRVRCSTTGRPTVNIPDSGLEC